MTQIKATNVVWHEGHVERAGREKLLGQQGCTIWLTGLPSSGKSTIGFSLEHMLVQQGRMAYVLDGDNIRHGLNKDLDFSDAGRVENIRRIGEVAKLFVDAGLIVVTAFISPFRSDRRMVRELVQQGEFVEVFVNTPIEVCEQRDPKGLYAKARAGQIPNFTGVTSPYEAPEAAEIEIDTSKLTVAEGVDRVIRYLEAHGRLKN